MRKFQNGELFKLQALLNQCARLGNVPTALATGHNLRRIDSALKAPREMIDSDEDMKYFAQNYLLAKTVDAFDAEKYDEAAALNMDAELSESGKQLRAYYDDHVDHIDEIKAFDADKFAAGEQKIKDLEQEENQDFVPYLYNMDKLSDDLGNPRANAALVEALMLFEQE